MARRQHILSENNLKVQKRGQMEGTIVMLKTKVFSALASLALFAPASSFAHGGKTPEVIAVGDLARCFRIYHEVLNKGYYPASWDEFENTLDQFDPSRLKRPKELLNIKDNYILLNPPINLRATGKSFKVLAIAINGNLPERSHNDDPGRFMIIHDSDGAIRSRGMSEAALQRAFGQAGLDLAKYTRELPAPPKETPNLSPPSPTQNPGKNSSEQESELFEENLKEKSKQSEKESATSQPWKIAGILFILLISAIVLRFVWNLPKGKNS